MENISNDLGKNISHDIIKKKISNIIIIINKIISDNNNNLNLIRKDIDIMVNKIQKSETSSAINNIILFKTENYNNGKYIGEFNNGKREGKGTYYFNDGERYEGDWKNNKQEGKGIYYYKNGNKYDGDWKNNIKEGRGVFYFINRRKI